MYFNAAEIPNFFTDEECEMIIELAQEKGLKESPLSQDTGQIIDKDSVEDLLKDWDKNNDGFVDKTEVRQIIYQLFLSTWYNTNKARNELNMPW